MAKKKKKVVGTKAARRKTTSRSAAPQSTSRWRKPLADLSRFTEHSKLLKPALIAFAAVAVVLLILSTTAGINGDEDVQIPYSQNLLSWYATGGEDSSAYKSVKGDDIRYYGGLYEIPVALVNRALGFETIDQGHLAVRHVFSMLFGLLAVFFTFLLTRELGGVRAAILAMILLFLSPRFIGHSMINPKDIPFAAGYIMATYYIYMLIKVLPKWHWKNLILLGVAIGICVGVRINGGMLLVAYLGLTLGVYFLLQHGIANVTQWSLVKPYLLSLLIPSAIGLALGLLFWPYGLSDPLNHIPEALEAFSNFQTAIKVLFQGVMVWSSDIPVRYLGSWMFFTVPLFVILGLVAFLAFLKPMYRSHHPLGLSLVIFTFAFPLIFIIVSGSALYDGWRHFSFVYPSLVVMVALAWHFLLEKYALPNKVAYVVMGILALTALEPLVFQARNSPFMYTYFNPLAGGIGGAFGNYELDYWGTSVKQGVDWLDKEGIISVDQSDTITIATNFSFAARRYTAKKYGGKVRVTYQRYRERGSREWDYAIWVNRFIDGSYLREDPWPTSKTLHEIKANGTPIAIVEKQDPENLIYQGLQNISAGNWLEAIPYLSLEVEKYPDNEVALTNLGMAYINTQQLPLAKEVLERALAISPESILALNYLGFYHFSSQNYSEAQAIYSRAVKANDRNATAHYYLGVIASQQNNPSRALQHVQDCLQANGRFKNCYTLGAQLHEQLGDQRSAAAFRKAASQL